MAFKLLDLFCGAGGAADGYVQAGFEVVGVDIVPQPDYPYPFYQRDALSLTYAELLSFDAIHASPPCQDYSHASALVRKQGYRFPDLYQPTKAMLVAAGLPYVIENVMGSPIRGALGLCGTMFGLGVFRHRLFESNIPLRHPDTPCTCTSKRIDNQHYFTVAGSMTAKRAGLQAMGIHRNMSKRQMNEAIPPAYTEWIGHQLIAFMRGRPSPESEQLLIRSSGAGLAQLSLW